MPGKHYPENPVRGYRNKVNQITKNEKAIIQERLGSPDSLIDTETKMMVHDECAVETLLDRVEDAIWGKDGLPMNVPIYVQGMVGLSLILNSLMNSEQQQGKRAAYERLQLFLDGLALQLSKDGIPVERIVTLVPKGCGQPGCDCAGEATKEASAMGGGDLPPIVGLLNDIFGKIKDHLDPKDEESEEE